MAHILSEDSTLSLYDKGHKVFRTSFNLKESTLPTVDLDQILETAHPKKDFQALAPQVLYFSLKDKGLEDSLSALPFVSKEQFVKLMDYDAWERGELSPKRMFQWLDLYKKIEPKQMVERYRDLEEEYQIATLSPYVRAYTEEEFEKMSDAEQDSLFSFPGKEIHFSIVGLDEKTTESVLNFFEIAGEFEIEYAVSLLAHLTYDPPVEQEELLAQFRNARLEEDGFVTEEEARSIFYPIDTKSMERKIEEIFASVSRETSKIPSFTESEDFLQSVLMQVETTYPEDLARIKQSLLFLVNAVSAAVQADVSDVPEMKQLMKVSSGTVSLGLDLLSKGNISFAAEILAKTFHPKEIFCYSLSHLNELKRDFLKSLSSEGLICSKKYLENLDLLKYGALLDQIDSDLLESFGSEGVEVIKAFLGRFPFYPKIKKVTEEKASSVLLFSFMERASHLEEAKNYLDYLKNSVRKAS